MPVQFEGIIQEHHSVRNKAGLFDVSHMGELEITGSEAELFLNTILTNDIDVYKRQYLAFDIRPENLNNARIGIKALDLKGFNVTIPHKEAMIGLVDSLDPYAKKLGAINTVKVKDGQLIGYNTDGQGFIKSLKRKNISVKDKSIVIIGAGGAARSIAVYIGLEGPKEIRIVNRTYDRGKVLANLVNDLTGSYIASPARDVYKRQN